MNLSQGHSKTLHFRSTCTVQMETGFREEEEGEEEEQEEEEEEEEQEEKEEEGEEET